MSAGTWSGAQASWRPGQWLSLIGQLLATEHLILIKHAMPEIDEQVPSHRWSLSQAGRLASRQLADEIARYRPAVVVTSVEPKAAETGAIVARALGITCRQWPDLQENDRTGLPYLDDAGYEATFRRFFSAPDETIVGRESARQAAERFAAAASDVLAADPDSTIALVAHGTVISLCLHRLTGLDPFALWQRLGLPSYVVLRRPEMTLERIVERIAPARC